MVEELKGKGGWGVCKGCAGRLEGSEKMCLQGWNRSGSGVALWSVELPGSPAVQCAGLMNLGEITMIDLPAREVVSMEGTKDAWELADTWRIVI